MSRPTRRCSSKSTGCVTSGYCSRHRAVVDLGARIAAGERARCMGPSARSAHPTRRTPTNEHQPPAPGCRGGPGARARRWRGAADVHVRHRRRLGVANSQRRDRPTRGRRSARRIDRRRRSRDRRRRGGAVGTGPRRHGHRRCRTRHRHQRCRATDRDRTRATRHARGTRDLRLRRRGCAPGPRGAGRNQRNDDDRLTDAQATILAAQWPLCLGADYVVGPARYGSTDVVVGVDESLELAIAYEAANCREVARARLP